MGLDGTSFKKTLPRYMWGLKLLSRSDFIVTELVSNSLIYAFPEGRSAGSCSASNAGRIHVGTRRSGQWVGLPADVKMENARTLGLDLVRIFSRQLEGHLDVRHNQGTEFSLRFDFRQ